MNRFWKAIQARWRAFRKYLNRRAYPWRITRYNRCGWECERYNRLTGQFQHRHYTAPAVLFGVWEAGKNPYRDNAFEPKRHDHVRPLLLHP